MTVPTPIKKNKKPDFSPLFKACEFIGKNLKENAIIIFESTVYPGATRELCVPIIERYSKKKWKKKKPKLSHLHPLKVNLKKNLLLHQAAPHPNKVKKKKVMAKVKKILKKKLFNRDNYQRNMHF